MSAYAIVRWHRVNVIEIFELTTEKTGPTAGQELFSGRCRARIPAPVKLAAERGLLGYYRSNGTRVTFEEALVLARKVRFYGLWRRPMQLSNGWERYHFMLGVK